MTVYLGAHEVSPGCVTHEFAELDLAIWMLWHGRHAAIGAEPGPWFEVEL